MGKSRKIVFCKVAIDYSIYKLGVHVLVLLTQFPEQTRAYGNDYI